MAQEVLANTLDQSSDEYALLRAKYKKELSTLKELFSSWTDEDLLSSLQEVNGDLERAINRISEGHASQWSEAKTRKHKRETQQAPKKFPAQAQAQPQEQSQTYKSKGYPDRGERGSRNRGGRSRGRGGKRDSGGRRDYNNSANRHRNPNKNTEWHNSSSDQNDQQNDSIPTWDNVEASEMENPSNDMHKQNALPKTSWAQVVNESLTPKKEPKPSPEKPKKENKEIRPSSPEKNIKPTPSPEKFIEENEISAAPVERVEQYQEVVKHVEPISEPKRTPLKTTNRKFLSEGPVIFQNKGSSSVSNMSVKFGSLTVGGEPESLEPSPNVEIKNNGAEEIENINSQLEMTSSAPLEKVSHEIVDSNAIQSDQGTQQNVDSTAVNHYPSYGPSHPFPTSVAMNPLSSMPEYSPLYVTGDSQRVPLNSYYGHPSHYSHNPVPTTSGYQSRDSKYNVDINATSTSSSPSTFSQSHSQPQPQQPHQPSLPQQSFPPNLGSMPYPYYPYYLPNQYPTGAYQASGYGQPYVNKNLYPVYHPHQQVSSSRKPTSFQTYQSNPSANGYGTPYTQANLSQNTSGYEDTLPQSTTATSSALTQSNSVPNSQTSHQDYANKHSSAAPFNAASNTPMYLGHHSSGLVENQATQSLGISNPMSASGPASSKIGDRSQMITENPQNSSSGRYMQQNLTQPSSYYNQYSYPGGHQYSSFHGNSGMFNPSSMHQNTYGYSQSQQTHSTSQSGQSGLPSQSQGSPSSRPSTISSKQQLSHSTGTTRSTPSHSHQTAYWGSSQS